MSRIKGGACRAQERQVTEDEFAAYAGFRILPGEGEIPAGTTWCYDPLKPAAFPRGGGGCLSWEQTITESVYAAYVGSAEPPPSVGTSDSGMIYCLDQRNGLIYSGALKECNVGDRSIDRTEYLRRMKVKSSGVSDGS